MDRQARTVVQGVAAATGAGGGRREVPARDDVDRENVEQSDPIENKRRTEKEQIQATTKI